MQLQTEEKIKKPSWVHQYWKVLCWEVILFSLTLILGIISSLRIIQSPEIEVQKIPMEPRFLWEFILSFSVVFLIVFLIIRFVKFRPGKGILFKIFFIIPVFVGGTFFLELWIGEPFALILISLLIFYWIKKPNLLVHNFLLISGMIGVGSVFGLRLDPLLVVFLLIIFSIYDIIAVYKTKHMIKMAKEMIEAGAIPGLILPPKISEFQAPLKDVKVGGRFVILGGGDIVFPLLLVASIVPYSVLDSAIVAISATFGLLVSFLIFALQKTRQPIPALPPIATFSILGYLMTIIL